MPLMPGAEPYESLLETSTGRSVGVLLCHGFSGSPASLKPWAHHLEAQGWSVTVPRLPGHGTRWQDMNLTRWTDWYAEAQRALTRLTDHCDRVVLAGLSMGATLAVRLTEQHTEALGGRLVGTVVVNPSLATERKDAFLLPVLRRFVPSFPGISNDIAKPGVDEVAYDRLPLKAAYELQLLWAATRADLGAVTTPLLLFRSAVDHVVEAVSSRILLEGVAASDVTEQVLERSYHVATLDHDAELIYAESTTWIAART